MYAKVTICFLASLCVARGYVIIGSRLYNTVPPQLYNQPFAVSPSPETIQSHQEYVQGPVVSPVRTVSKLTYEVPLSEKDEHSDEVVIAGPSGVIKTHRKSSRPVLAHHTTRVITNNLIEPQPQLVLQPQPQPQPQQESERQPQSQTEPQPQPQPQPQSQPQPQLQFQPQPQPEINFQPQPQTLTQQEPQPATYFTSPIVRIEQHQIPDDFPYQNTDFNPEAFLAPV